MTFHLVLGIETLTVSHVSLTTPLGSLMSPDWHATLPAHCDGGCIELVPIRCVSTGQLVLKQRPFCPKEAYVQNMTPLETYLALVFQLQSKLLLSVLQLPTLQHVLLALLTRL